MIGALQVYEGLGSKSSARDEVTSIVLVDITLLMRSSRTLDATVTEQKYGKSSGGAL